MGISKWNSNSFFLQRTTKKKTSLNGFEKVISNKTVHQFIQLTKWSNIKRSTIIDIGFEKETEKKYGQLTHLIYHHVIFICGVVWSWGILEKHPINEQELKDGIKIVISTLSPEEISSSCKAVSKGCKICLREKGRRFEQFLWINFFF